MKYQFLNPFLIYFNRYNKYFLIIFIFFILEITTLIGFTKYLHGVDSNITAVSMTAILVLTGYFITHELESSRNSKSRKLDLCLDLIKSLRLFLKEPYYNKTLEQKAFRDKFIDSYLSFSIFISPEAYKKLQNTFVAFKEFVNHPVSPAGHHRA